MTPTAAQERTQYAAHDLAPDGGSDAPGGAFRGGLDHAVLAAGAAEERAERTFHGVYPATTRGARRAARAARRPRCRGTSGELLVCRFSVDRSVVDARDGRLPS